MDGVVGVASPTFNSGFFSSSLISAGQLERGAAVASHVSLCTARTVYSI